MNTVGQVVIGSVHPGGPPIDWASLAPIVALSGGALLTWTDRKWPEYQEPLIGTLSYLPGSDGRQTGQAGHESNDRAKFDFGEKGVFVTEPHTATFPLRPNVADPFAFGSYVATAKVAPDPAVSSGRFVNATGNISIIGTFLVDMFSMDSAGVWNAEVSGKLCHVR